MNRKILLTMLLALICVLAVSAVQASDVNITDSNTIGSSDDAIQLESESQTSDVALQLDGESQTGDEESVYSNTLSTNNEELVLEEDAKNQTELTAPTNTVYYKGSYSVELKDSNTNSTLANK